MLEGLLELLLGDVAVISLELLLGAQLEAEVGDLALAALAVLAGAIFAAVDRALGPSEDVFAHAAVELILGAFALRHEITPIRVSKCPEPHHPTNCRMRSPLHRTCEINCEGRRLAEACCRVKASAGT